LAQPVSLGDLEGAGQLHKHTLAARRRVLGEDHPDTLQSMNNLAATRWALDDLDSARELLSGPWRQAGGAGRGPPSRPWFDE
jgi:hypothetical protein